MHYHAVLGRPPALETFARNLFPPFLSWALVRGPAQLAEAVRASILQLYEITSE